MIIIFAVFFKVVKNIDVTANRTFVALNVTFSCVRALACKICGKIVPHILCPNISLTVLRSKHENISCMKTRRLRQNAMNSAIYCHLKGCVPLQILPVPVKTNTCLG